MARVLADSYARVRHLVPEMAKFGVVGGLGSILDLGGAAVLHSAYHEGALESKAISITAAMIFTYLGSRFWTFRHRENQPMMREAVLFVVLNVIGLVVAELVIAATTYGLGLKGPLAYNAASLVGTGMGTIFRFYAYRKWVFLAPAQHAPVPVVAAASFAEYPPWELEAEYSGHEMRYPGHDWLDQPVFPNGRVASPVMAAAAAPAWAPAPAQPPAPAWAPAPALAPASAWAPAPTPAERPAPAHRPVPSAPRSPGRHRKTR